MKKRDFTFFFAFLLSFFIAQSIYGQTVIDEETGLLIWDTDAVKMTQNLPDNYGLAEIPNVIHAEFAPSETEEKTAFPEKYDAREKGYITPVKNQKPYDLCWAESVLSMAESNLIKKGLADPSLNLSEIFAHYFQWNRVPDPMGLTAGDENIWRAYESYPGYIREWINSWGSGYRAVLLLSGWPGITTEDVAPYPTEETDVTNYFLEPSLAWNSSVAKMENAWWISMNDTQAIKRMIMKHGSAVIAFYQNKDQYLNQDTGAYYCSDPRYTNHLVNVIGWDDSYPSYNFRTAPDRNGAWLVKNSFGTEWGNEGYFWLSYADKSLSEDAFIYDFTPIESGVKTYQYDGSVDYNYINDPNSNVITAANVFTAFDNEKLLSVGFISPSSYYSYKIEVYRGVKDTPDSGILFSKQSGEELYAGCHTIQLENPVDLAGGDRFSVIVEITAGETGKAYIMTDRSESYKVTDANGDEVVYQEFVSTSFPGESYYRTSNGNWIDCWNADPAKSLGNVRIKAFTKFMSYPGIKSLEKETEVLSEDNRLDFYRIESSSFDPIVPNFSISGK